MSAPPDPSSRATVVSLAERRGRLHRAAAGRKARIWAPRILLLLGVPAGALLWNAAGRPSPLHILPAFRPPPEPSRIEGDVIDGRRLVLVDGATVGYGSERIRIANIDAPESLTPRCAAERAAGLRLKERLAELVRVEHVAVARSGRDPSGRLLATLSVGGSDIGKTLVAEGLVLPWREGPEARLARIRHWCG
jgi:endonuclease YncB( thermonuclease family)